MLILAIETSCREGGVALLRDGRLLGKMRMDTRLNHSAGLVSAIRELLAGSGYEREDVEGIGVDVGPGSFTGVRVGVAAARGLARGLSASLTGVTSLEALVSADTSGSRYLFPLIDARGGFFYGALFGNGDGRMERLTEIKLLKPLELTGEVPKGTYFFGPGLSACRDELEKEIGSGAALDVTDRFPTAAGVAVLAAEKLTAGRPDDPKPVYLRAYVKKQ